MKHHVFLVFIVITFCSCDVSNSKNINLDNSIDLSHLENFKHGIFITDTVVLCENGIYYRLIITNERINKKKTFNEIDLKANLIIIRINDTLINKTFTKENFNITDKEFLSKAGLHLFKFDGLECKNETIKLFCGISYPETDWTYAFEIYFSKDGKQSVYELDEEGTATIRQDIK